MLVADDDDYTREGLAEAVDWTRYGIEEVYQARDGEEALRIALTHRPDIVLTDIRMPRLNGIAFAERLAADCPGSKLLFMSGYMDIAYLKSAIKLSAVDYIEKPIRIPELEDAVRKTAEAIRQRRRQHELAGQKTELDRYKLANMLRTGSRDDEEIRRLCAETGYSADRHYVCLAVRFGTEGEDAGARLAAVDGLLRRQSVPAIGELVEKEVAVVIAAFHRQEEARVESAVAALLRQFPDVTIGIGHAAAGLGEVAESCKAAVMALQRSFYRPAGRRFAYEEAKQAPAIGRSDVFASFVRCLKVEPDRLSEWMNALCDEMTRAEYPGKEGAVSMFASFAQAMLGEKNGMLLRLGRIYQARDVGETLARAESIEAIRQFMLELCEAYREEVREAQPYSRIVRDIMAYIASRCSDADLDVGAIAGHFHMSAAHLGTLFKQETGTTMKQYLSDYRLELAKKLIGSNRYRMHEIAEMCGYASAGYFAKVFKAATGWTPVEYRKRTYE